MKADPPFMAHAVGRCIGVVPRPRSRRRQPRPTQRPSLEANQVDSRSSFFLPTLPSLHLALTLTPSHQPAFNQFAFFEVQPGHSFHSVEEVVVEGDGQKGGVGARVSLSGWFHKPVEGEPGFEGNEGYAAKSSLQQLVRPLPLSLFPNRALAEAHPAFHSSSTPRLCNLPPFTPPPQLYLSPSFPPRKTCSSSRPTSTPPTSNRPSSNNSVRASSKPPNSCWPTFSSLPWLTSWSA